MGAKKRLRRRVAQLEHDLGLAERGQEKEFALREDLHQRLFEAGLLVVTGSRTQADRIRAAQAGVIVLGDVHVVDAEQSATATEPAPTAFHGDVRYIAGPIEHRLRLDLIVDPQILGELGVYMQQHR